MPPQDQPPSNERGRVAVGLTRARRWLRRSWLDLLGVTAAVVYALPSLGYPFGLDQPIHYYIGKLMLNGEAPYLSGISTKPPAPFVVYALSILLFGDHQYSIRIVDILFVVAIGAMVATYRSRRRDPGGRVLERDPRSPGELGASCLLFSALYYSYFGFSDTAHPDTWQGAFMLLPFWVIARSPDRRLDARRAFAAGVAACVAVLFKHTAAVSGFVAGVMVVSFALSRRDWREALRNAGAYTLGVASILAVTALVFFLWGAFDALWEVQVDFLLWYATEGVRGIVHVPRFLGADYGGSMIAFVVIALLIGFGIDAVTRNRRERDVGAWIVVALASALASVAAQRRIFFGDGFTYHVLAVLPFAALAVMWGLRQRLRGRGAAQLVVVVAITATAFWIQPKWTSSARWSYQKEWHSFVSYTRGQQSWSEYHRMHDNGVLEDYVRLNRLADYIRHRARPRDTLCVDGFISVLYALTDMRCTSRFQIGGDLMPGQPRWRAEHERTLREHPPTFFVTFGTRPAVRTLTGRGYTRQDFRYSDGGWYVILERPRE